MPREGRETGPCTNPHNVWLLKTEGMNSLSLYNEWDLQPRTLKVSLLSTGQARRVSVPKETATCKERQRKNSSLYNATEWGEGGGTKWETDRFILIL